MNLENRSVYVNKDACGEFYKCTLGGGCHECCGSCFRVELFQYSDGWVSNSSEGKEGVYISHFKEKKSRKDKIRLLAAKPARCPSVSANADLLKACLDRSIDLIKER